MFVLPPERRPRLRRRQRNEPTDEHHDHGRDQRRPDREISRSPKHRISEGDQDLRCSEQYIERHGAAKASEAKHSRLERPLHEVSGDEGEIPEPQRVTSLLEGNSIELPEVEGRQ